MHGPMIVDAIRLNLSYFTQWAKAVEVYFRVKKQYKYVTKDPPLQIPSMLFGV